VDPAAVTTTHLYDSFGNLTSTTEGAAGTIPRSAFSTRTSCGARATRTRRGTSSAPS
jgi:hypothetical protein